MIDLDVIPSVIRRRLLVACHVAESGISMVVKATDNSAMPAAPSLRQIR